ncbi:hypothetical protein BC827DRAFT_465783 [Russula dissimulans]|nr:hypothetical protein BC827DRAFT_465783 [Russula dissimulans]
MAMVAMCRPTVRRDCDVERAERTGEPGERMGVVQYVADAGSIAEDGREGRQRGMSHHRRQRKSLGASSPDLISARGLLYPVAVCDLTGAADLACPAWGGGDEQRQTGDRPSRGDDLSGFRLELELAGGRGVRGVVPVKLIFSCSQLASPSVKFVFVYLLTKMTRALPSASCPVHVELSWKTPRQRVLSGQL